VGTKMAVIVGLCNLLDVPQCCCICSRQVPDVRSPVPKMEENDHLYVSAFGLFRTVECLAYYKKVICTEFIFLMLEILRDFFPINVIKFQSAGN
jgi:hypothetical protein